MTGYTDAEIAKIKYNASYRAVQRFWEKNYKGLKRNGITRQYLQDLSNYFASQLKVEFNENYNDYQKTHYVSLLLYDRLHKELYKDLHTWREYPVEYIGELARNKEKPGRYQELYNDLYAFADKDILNDNQKTVLKYILQTGVFNEEDLCAALKLSRAVIGYCKRTILKKLAEYFRDKYPDFIEGPILQLAYDPTMIRKSIWERKTKEYFNKVLTEPLFLQDFIKFHGARGNRKHLLQSMIASGEILVVRKRDAQNRLLKAYVLKQYYKG